MTSDRSIIALDGPVSRWSVETSAPWGCLLLDNGLLLTAETDGLTVREQRSGAVVSTIEVTALSDPALTSDGLLVFVASRQGGPALCATSLAGEPEWEVHLREWSSDPPLVQQDRVIVTEGAIVRAFDGNGSPVWMADQHEFRVAPGPVDRNLTSAEVDGPLVGLPGGNILVPIRSDDVMGYLVVDPRQGAVHPVPAHLRPGPLAVPIRDIGRDLLVMPGWPDKGDYGEFRPTVTVVDLDTGIAVSHHGVPTAPHSIVAGSTGLVAMAGSPSWHRWSHYHGQPGIDLRPDCYVLFLDTEGICGTWKPGKPITGPLAVGADGDLLVPVSGELISLE